MTEIEQVKALEHLFTRCLECFAAKQWTEARFHWLQCATFFEMHESDDPAPPDNPMHD